MARKKIILDRIPNDATRRATFKKRRRGLVKKASELATLCDVDTCLVVYGEGETEPEVWPSMEGAKAVLEHFKALPEMDQCKKMMNQEDFLRQRITKLMEQIRKMGRENHERETTLLLHQALSGHLGNYNGITVEQLTSLDCIVSTKLKVVSDCLAELRAQNDVLVSPLPVLLPLSPAPPSMAAPVMAARHAFATSAILGPPPGFEGININQVDHDQNSWLMDVAKNGGDLGALVFSGFVGTSNGASTSTSSLDMNVFSTNPDMAGYGWSWDDSVGLSFPPM
ncbi:agamous-like MADS-box protein AGL80 [Oryza brachyantha]|uniref:MADS-box domain-containing protein n=1 Tax=Oryza brachyantha TaxID=4533 RepID=J3KYW9_ORYBR|nr:agamous-like MADS-box protein AGL80 [Oryza brachyantha]